MVWLVACNGESACMGGMIDGGNTMLFLGMITFQVLASVET
jgi:hypothetical protein